MSILVSGLRCWDCRSDGINSSFCGDYFDKDLISDQQRSYVYTNCTVPESIKNPPTVPIVAVCRVIKQTGKLLYHDTSLAYIQSTIHRYREHDNNNLSGMLLPRGWIAT